MWQAGGTSGHFTDEYLDSFPLVMKIMAICSPAGFQMNFNIIKAFLWEGRWHSWLINPDQLNFTFTQKITTPMNIFGIIITLHPDGSLHFSMLRRAMWQGASLWTAGQFLFRGLSSNQKEAGCAAPKLRGVSNSWSALCVLLPQHGGCIIGKQQNNPNRGAV